MCPPPPPYRAVATADGTTSAVDPATGEGFHDTHGAWLQARVRYAGGVGLRARGFAAARTGNGVVRLLDVGTGLGWNLAAALSALHGTGARLHAVSLERDPDVLRFAADLSRAGTGEAEWCHRAMRQALRVRLALLPRDGAVDLALDGAVAGSLDLRLGDARDTLRALPGERFDAVFLDPFSPRVAPELWAAEFCAEIAARMAPGALLATYSAATAVRLALAAAGLGVARAGRVGGKAEGTLAGPGLVAPAADEDLVRMLARRLAERGPEPGGGENPAGARKRDARCLKIAAAEAPTLRRPEARQPR
jgi:tRNA U34 5-methylaminomethyl-2-thiouridine-forming methyltransferase MnmC